jgi:hypothetical protein
MINRGFYRLGPQGDNDESLRRIHFFAFPLPITPQAFTLYGRHHIHKVGLPWSGEGKRNARMFWSSLWPFVLFVVGVVVVI